MADHYRNLRPRLPQNYVEAPHIDSWVNGVMGKTLTAFLGPAGYGKTSAIVSIARRLDALGIDVAWLRVENTDNFSEALFTSMYQALGQQAGCTETEVNAPGQVNQDMLLQRIRDIREPFVLVLDDLEYINDETALVELSRLISRASENAHFIVASRNLQGFPLSQLMVEGRLQLIKSDALALGSTQAARLLNDFHGLGLEEDMVSAVAGRVENWPAGLQMTALFLKAGRPVDAVFDARFESVSDISTYLWEKVFQDLPDEMRQFLFETSFLDRLNGDLCECVTGRQNSAELLEEAYKANLFLTLMDETEGIYRYHNLFAAFLRKKLRQNHSRDEIRIMHERAAAWHATHSDYETALARLFEVSAWDMACRVLRECAWTVLGKGRIRTLLSWFETIPEYELQKHSALLVAYGWALILSNKISECGKLVRYLKKTGDALNEGEFAVLEPMVLAFDDRFEDCRKVLPSAFKNTPSDAHLALGTLYNLETLLLLNRRDYASVVPLAEKARAEFLKAGAGYGENYTAWFYIASLLSQGFLKQAHQAAQENWRRTKQEAPRFSSASALASICLAQTSFHRGELIQARQMITENFDILCETAMIDNVADAIRIMNRIHCLAGNVEEAEAWLALCGAKTRARESERLNRVLAVESGYVAIRAFDLGLTHKKPALLSMREGVEGNQYSPISEDVENEWVHNMRIMIRDVPLEKNLSMIRHQIQLARAKRQGNLLLKLYILHAQTLVKSGQEKRALKVLEDCARLAASEGFISHFHEEGPVITRLTDALCEALRPTQYLKRDHDLVAFFKNDAANKPLQPRQVAGASTLQGLTKREAQVFDLLGFGLSNDAIATRMSISVNTVKFHLKNVYAKLEIEGRVRAVSVAASSHFVHGDQGNSPN